MASGLYKTCGTNGDYADLFNAIDQMLTSGVAAAGAITHYYLNVLNGKYTGSFNINIPYTGEFFVYSSGIPIELNNTCYATGIFSISNFYIQCSSLYDFAFIVPSGSEHNYNNLYFINCYSGIQTLNDTVVNINDTKAIGNDVGLFIQNISGDISINNSDIAKFNTAVYTNERAGIKQSRLYDNGICVHVGISGILNSEKTLMYNSATGVYLEGTMTSSHITNECSVPISSLSGYFLISDSILVGSDYCIKGSVITGCYISYSNLYPSGISVTGPAPTSTGLMYNLPKFNNQGIGDHRLKIHELNGSPCITGGLNNFDENIIINVNESQFLTYDNHSNPISDLFPFVFKQGTVIKFSDYDQEVRLADIRSSYGNTEFRYSQIFNLTFSESGVITDSIYNAWDWDYKTFHTTKIVSNDNYIIPRSRLNIKTIIDSKLTLDYESLLGQINKSSIKVYNKLDYRGISYDFDLTKPGESIVWVLEGRNQLLLKRNSFTGEIIEKYPLLCIDDYSTRFIKPSGLVYIGVDKDMYRFISVSDPNKEYLGYNENGDFKFIDTAMDVNYDIRGLLTYKDRIYMTCTQYYSPIYDHDTYNTTLEGQGKILVYDNNLNFDHYIYKVNTDYGPKELIIPSGNLNIYPTDITIYEDGHILVSDYSQANKIYRYKFAYDYALKQISIDKEARVLLRENYDDVYV